MPKWKKKLKFSLFLWSHFPPPFFFFYWMVVFWLGVGILWFLAIWLISSYTKCSMEPSHTGDVQGARLWLSPLLCGSHRLIYRMTSLVFLRRQFYSLRFAWDFRFQQIYRFGFLHSLNVSIWAGFTPVTFQMFWQLCIRYIVHIVLIWLINKAIMRASWIFLVYFKNIV